MKTCRNQTETVVVKAFYLCKQAWITYDAEPKICDMKPDGGEPTRSGLAGRMQKQEDCRENVQKKRR